jgi:signal transduction histidine kinase
MSWPRRVAIAIAGLTGLAIVAGAVLAAQSPRAGDIAWLAVAAGMGLPSTVLGMWVARRRPANVVGVLLTAAGLVPCVLADSDVLTAVDQRRPGVVPGADVLKALGVGAWMWWYVPIALLALVFPTGQLLRPRGRMVAVGLPAVAVAFCALLATGPNDESNPGIVLLPVLLGLLVATAVSVVRRHRRAHGVARAQLTWFALAGMFLPLTLLLCWTSYLLLGKADLVLVGLILVYLAIPAATAIAMLRHDLYDVDRALAVAVAYTIATAVLLAVFTAVSFGTGLVLGRNSVAVAAATTAVCALVLAPLRVRLQRRVDRRLYPARQAALSALDDLRARIHSGHSEPERLESVLAKALRDPSLKVGYRLPGGDDLVDASGELMSTVDEETPILVGGVEIGVLQWSGGSRELRRELAQASALLAELVRLRLELREALHEVGASRTRLQQIGYQERRRLERDLHDGAQQRLVSLGMALRLAQRHLSDGTVDVNGLLDQSVAELGTAVAELRQLAHGLRPSSLDDGLGPALAALTSTMPVPVELEVRAPTLPDDVSTTAYYVASEAVANAAKHAQAGRIGLRVALEEGQLLVEVADDGVGGAAPRAGSGLAGLADRVAAAGGSLRVHSPSGAGTIVEAVLPCAS